MERILEFLSQPLVLIIISFAIGNGLRRLPPAWKVIVYLIIEAIEHLIYPLPLRRMVKRLVNSLITEGQKKLLDQTLGNLGYLQKSKKGA